MTIFKKILAACVITLSLTATGTVSAEEATNVAAIGLTETITSIEKALTEVNNSDFASARLHIKTARMGAEALTGDHAKINAAVADIVQGQIQANRGNSKESADYLSKALTVFKAL
jgi:predicted negative regulator of RcsB-dependent stress response